MFNGLYAIDDLIREVTHNRAILCPSRCLIFVNSTGIDVNGGLAIEDIVRESRRREGLDVCILDGRIVEDALAYRLDFLADNNRREHVAPAKGFETNRSYGIGNLHHLETREPEGSVFYLVKLLRQAHRDEFLEAIECISAHDIQSGSITLIVRVTGSHDFGFRKVYRRQIVLPNEFAQILYVPSIYAAADGSLDGIGRQRIGEDARFRHDHVLRPFARFCNFVQGAVGIKGVKSEE